MDCLGTLAATGIIIIEQKTGSFVLNVRAIEWIQGDGTPSLAYK